MDAQGKKMEYEWRQDKKKRDEGYYSKYSPEDKPFWFDEFNYANRGMVHETRNYLIPNGITVETLDDYTKKIENDIVKLKEQRQLLSSEDAIKIKANQINDERLANNIVERTLPEVVNDFTKLNYLLSDTKITATDKSIEVPTIQCPPLDDEGKVRIDEEGLVLLGRCIDNDPDTKRLHTNEAGEYTEERMKLHEYIIHDMTSKTICIPQEKGHPIAVLMGGAPGSGKSTYIKKNAKYLESDKIWKVDADAVREYLPEYEGWNSQSTHQESRDIVNELISTFDKPCKHDLLYDGTMSNSKKYISLIKELKRIGYLVFIIYMDVPKEVSIQRAMNRYRNNSGGKTKYGRYVPMSVIDDFYKTGKEGLDEIKKSVDGYVVVDSLTEKIIQKGGIPLPKDRYYENMVNDSPKTESKEESISDDKRRVLEAIETIEGLLGIVDGKDLIKLQKRKSSLEELVDIL
jgi:predicted ABC-type ATPase